MGLLDRIFNIHVYSLSILTSQLHVHVHVYIELCLQCACSVVTCTWVYVQLACILYSVSDYPIVTWTLPNCPWMSNLPLTMYALCVYPGIVRECPSNYSTRSAHTQSVCGSSGMWKTASSIRHVYKADIQELPTGLLIKNCARAYHGEKITHTKRERRPDKSLRYHSGHHYI